MKHIMTYIFIDYKQRRWAPMQKHGSWGWWALMRCFITSINMHTYTFICTYRYICRTLCMYMAGSCCRQEMTCLTVKACNRLLRQIEHSFLEYDAFCFGVFGLYPPIRELNPRAVSVLPQPHVPRRRVRLDAAPTTR